MEPKRVSLCVVEKKDGVIKDVEINVQITRRKNYQFKLLVGG